MCFKLGLSERQSQPVSKLSLNEATSYQVLPLSLFILSCDNPDNCWHA